MCQCSRSNTIHAVDVTCTLVINSCLVQVTCDNSSHRLHSSSSAGHTLPSQVLAALKARLLSLLSHTLQLLSRHSISGTVTYRSVLRHSFIREHNHRSICVLYEQLPVSLRQKWIISTTLSSLLQLDKTIFFFCYRCQILFHFGSYN